MIRRNRNELRSNHRVIGAWHTSFHKVVEKARKDYSRSLGKELSMTEVTKIWGEGKLTKFRYPKLRPKR